MTRELPEFSNHFFPLRIVLTQTADEWSGLMRHLGVVSERPSAPASVSTFECSNGYDLIVVNINDVGSQSYSERLALYAHESVHVMQKVAKQTGAPLGTEAQAYLVQSLILWINAEAEEWV